MRSASTELNNYILSENARLAKTINPLSETPPDYHDQETCHQLQLEAGNVDKLTARVAELEIDLKEEVRVNEFLRKVIDTHSTNQDKRLEYLNDLLSKIDKQAVINAVKDKL
jgi:hypothetical protein